MDMSWLMGHIAQCIVSMPGQQVMCCVCVGTPAHFHGLLPDELSCSYWQVPQGMPMMNGTCSISIIIM